MTLGTTLGTDSVWVLVWVSVWVWVLVWVLVWVSVCSILTWNVPNLLCRAETPWSCRNRAGGSRACPRGEVVQLERGFGSGYGVEARKRKYRQD